MPENEESKRPKSKGVNRRQFLTRTAAGAAGAIALTSVLDACGGSSSNAPAALNDAQALTSGAWKFGVISDTQWTVPDDGYNPNTSAVAIAAQIQQQLIAQGVVFAVHVGDLCDIDTLSTTSGAANDGNSNPATNASAGEYTRALYSQSLYNAGIGFFPLRGNHDEDPGGAQAFQLCYPQTQNGQHTNPSAMLSKFGLSGISGDTYLNADAGNNAVPANSGSNFMVGSNFSSPNPWGDNGLNGLSYSFDYNGARFLLLDQFSPATGQFGTTGLAWATKYMEATIGGSAAYPSLGSAQQPWISQQLAGRSGSHSFVFAHKGLITCNHSDILFTPSSGGNGQPSYNASAQNTFFSSLYNNGVRMYINGHDHMHDRSIVTSPDGKSAVMQLVCASDSSKFYPPQGSLTNNANYPPSGSVIPLSSPSKQSSNDIYWNATAASSINPPTGPRRQVLSQELCTVGYYIYTINGALVNVDYYSADVPAYLNTANDSELLINTAQGLNFVRRETWGYGINGQQFVIASGKPYTTVQDRSSGGTTAKILGGANNCATTDACYLPYSKLITTGWAAASTAPGALSDILSLWGINPFVGASNPDTYVLSMGNGAALGSGRAICALDSYGNWTNAANLNTGGSKKFVSGPWNSSYGLGTYGIDPTTNTAWAVLNYTGMFAIAVGS